jgi:predicted transcriptional regulator
MLGWTQQQLADAAIISGTALKLLEKGATNPKMSTVMAVKDALEAAGIEFIAASSGKGAGVRLAHDD